MLLAGRRTRWTLRTGQTKLTQPQLRCAAWGPEGLRCLTRQPACMFATVSAPVLACLPAIPSCPWCLLRRGGQIGWGRAPSILRPRRAEPLSVAQRCPHAALLLPAYQMDLASDSEGGYSAAGGERGSAVRVLGAGSRLLAPAHAHAAAGGTQWQSGGLALGAHAR